MKIILLLFGLLLVSQAAYCEIYRWVDESGNVHFGDRKPQNIQTEEVKLKINTYTSVSYDTSIFEATPDKVIMYSTSWCGYCKKARKYFEANSIPYTEYDIEKNRSAKRRYDLMNAKGIPVILVGKKRMNGFSERGFKRIYK